MRAPLLLSLMGLSLLLSAPGPVQAQIDMSKWEPQIIGTASGFKDYRFSDEGWGPAGTLRFRLIPQRFLHFEFAYTYAAKKTQWSTVCRSTKDPWPKGYSCFDFDFSDTSNRVTGGLGLQAPLDIWRPFVGLGYGTSDGNPVWAWYAGLEVLPWDRFGLVAEYRAGEVKSQDHFRRTHELGVGIVWRLW